MACSRELTKAVIERCLETELDSHLGYPKHARKGSALGNTRNGQSQKTLKGEQGHVDIKIPRDRQGTFKPQLVKKGQTRMVGFDDNILALYAREPACARTASVYLVLLVDRNGQKELLGIWIAQTEGARTETEAAFNLEVEAREMGPALPQHQ